MIEPFERRRILFDGEINQPDKVASECICLGLGIKRTKAGERFGAFASLQKSQSPDGFPCQSSHATAAALLWRSSIAYPLEEAPNFVADIKR